MTRYMNVGLPNDDFRRTAERDFLKQHALKYSSGKILEIGAWKGASTTALCETNNHVTSVDVWESDDVYSDFCQMTARCANLTVVRETSRSFFKTSEDKFDLIFIDGDHSREMFYHDLMVSLSRLNPGGTLVCHDFTVAHSWIVAGVQKLGQPVSVAPVSCFFTAALSNIQSNKLTSVGKYEVLHAIRYAGTEYLIQNQQLKEYANHLANRTVSSEMVSYVKEMTDSSLDFATE